MWGNFAKCENILTSATPRPVRCFTIMSIKQEVISAAGTNTRTDRIMIIMLLIIIIIIMVTYYYCIIIATMIILNHLRSLLFAMYFLFWDFYFSFVFIIKGKMN